MFSRIYNVLMDMYIHILHLYMYIVNTNEFVLHVHVYTYMYTHVHTCTVFRPLALMGYRYSVTIMHIYSMCCSVVQARDGGPGLQLCQVQVRVWQLHGGLGIPVLLSCIGEP